MANEGLVDNETFDKALRRALEVNASSSVMYLLRERLAREIIETAMPIILAPYLRRIAELEAQVGRLATPHTKPGDAPPPRPPKGAKSDLKKSVEGLLEALKTTD